MPRSRRRTLLSSQSHPGRFPFLAHTIARLPPRQLPLLILYSFIVVYISKRGWIAPETLGKSGAAVVGVLSMVTGLLLSYRFSSALSKWDEGKKVWVGVRTDIRDGIRMTPLTRNDILRQQDLVRQRTDELSGLLVGFSFALQHHLHGTRPLPRPPLSDLLPPPFLSSLKRTEARVRFAEKPLGPSGITVFPSNASGEQSSTDSSLPGLRRRSTSQRREVDSEDDEWELSNLRDRAEEAMESLAHAVAGKSESMDAELTQQVQQLNIPEEEKEKKTADIKIKGMVNGHTATMGGTLNKPRSNLHSPVSNLPLALLRLMEAYVIGMAEVSKERGGWDEAKLERMLVVVKSLTAHLGEAERLQATPPPLPLTLHLSHLLLIYLLALPCSLLCVVSGYPVVFITIIAAWSFLGLETLVGEVGGVFGMSENHHPLPRYTEQIFSESLDISPGFAKSYRSRLVTRVGEDDDEVTQLDNKLRRGGEHWLPSF
ncbi:hypothetical protein TREMEDRAFT_68797 [Tremella mesenterica DSM 1558]|uniref:uncharacterized protein n=1 Tax=Tremella mesenterica (strain ATCC 24925 / CBS 8224 / DSM 1558 / NBRC 9311 / NRRL Y-6157 / RJB 2259-6 / UBC 559-6) TaxID=578456 RepID=UPI0003F49431|nr:uncharacterized protein TREMEDRAFT_68797 [Tremella mesenterica DSM 1558]EIW69644.1 hypothetical protein TREMEDRAFT_68797 [Tremella mesenterica DSM 1558]